MTILAFQTGKGCELIVTLLIDAVGERSTSLIERFTQMKHMFLEIFIIQVKTTGIIQIYRFNFFKRLLYLYLVITISLTVK